MFKKVLVANRGEIALRIIRACKELGIATVAVHSEADADSLHVRFSDEDVCIGPAPASASYLHIPSLIAAAEVTNADAIHPGYGFLAENAHFAEVCEECGITFIGPTAGMIRAMGDKALAREKMKSAGVPVIPGSEGILKDHNDALAWAKRIGYPVILKATAGGGGKGMRIVRNPSEMEKAFQTATAESAKAFNNGDMYIEKFFEKIRHIEVQLLGDKHGHVVHLGERDCSVQRKHQKLIEESPSPVIDEKTRQKLGKIAARGARKVGYDSVGTMEFIMDEKGRFYFMEMNTRIQVEHTVTEMVTGLDLIMDQIASAAGEKLAFTKSKCALRGHSIECRINAEDPDRNFMPCPGRITDFHVPGGPGVRVDTHVYTNYVVPPYYDSMIAKLIVGGRTRQEAILRMERALDEFIIEGIKTTIPFHKEVLKNKKFRKGGIFTSFLEELQDTKKK